MCRLGEFRLGTLHEYRSAERFSHGVLDESEGRELSTDTFDNVTEKNIDSKSPQVRRMFNMLGLANLTPVIIDGIKVTETRWAPDCYIYSLSESSEWSACSDPSYDACVEISDPTHFFAAIADALVIHHYNTLAVLGKNRIRGVVMPVKYVGHEVPWNVPPGTVVVEQLKDPEYAYQKECRACWEAIAPPIKALILTHRFIPVATRLLKTRDLGL